MHLCSFCARPAALRAGSLCLCDHCRRQLAALAPESPAYCWYAAAVKRALFPKYALHTRP